VFIYAYLDWIPLDISRNIFNYYWMIIVALCQQTRINKILIFMPNWFMFSWAFCV